MSEFCCGVGFSPRERLQAKSSSDVEVCQSWQEDRFVSTRLAIVEHV